VSKFSACFLALIVITMAFVVSAVGQAEGNLTAINFSPRVMVK